MLGGGVDTATLVAALGAGPPPPECRWGRRPHRWGNGMPRCIHRRFIYKGDTSTGPTNLFLHAFGFTGSTRRGARTTQRPPGAMRGARHTLARTDDSKITGDTSTHAQGTDLGGG